MKNNLHWLRDQNGMKEGTETKRLEIYETYNVIGSNPTSWHIPNNGLSQP